MTTFPTRVRRTRREAEDIRSFELVAPDGQPLPPFGAGAHIDVHVGDGLVRQYSLCNGPLDREAYSYIIAVKRDAASRGGSKGLHESVAEGDVLTIGPPRNSFPLDPTSRHTVLIAGGIGLTPLLSMARELRHTGRSFALHSFTRSRAHTAFRDVLTDPSWTDRVHLHEGVARRDHDRVLTDVLADTWAPGNALYMCGPQAFMRLIEDRAVAAGWPLKSVHREFFTPEAGAAGANSQTIEVVLGRSGETILVPADRSISEVLMEAGVDLEVSCEQGLCGTCVTRVIEGVPEHRDTFLTNQERESNGCIAICVSRSKTRRLVLDL